MLLMQYGHQDRPRTKKALQENLIDGVIFSPMYIRKDNFSSILEEFEDINPKAFFLFDSMMFLSNMGVNKTGFLGDYGYYKEYPTMFDCSSEDTVKEIVKNSIDIQRDLGLKRVSIPTLRIDTFDGWTTQTATRLIEKGLQYLEELGSSEDIYIELVIRQNAFEDTDSMNDFLNYLSMLSVKGIYLNVLRTEDSVNWRDVRILANVMYFIYSLQYNQLDIHVGYSDFEGALFLLVGASSFASGYWKNVRSLDRKKFMIRDGGRNPKPVYSSLELLSHVNIAPTIDSIAQMQLLDKIFIDKTPFNATEVPSDLDYKRNKQAERMLSVFKSLNEDITSVSGYLKRKEKITSMLNTTKQKLTTIKESKIITDNSLNTRLPEIWEEAILLFEKSANM